MSAIRIFNNYLKRKAYFTLGFFFICCQVGFSQSKRQSDSLEAIYASGNYPLQSELSILKELAVILIGRRFQKRHKWSGTLEDSKQRPVGTKKIFQETKQEEELPPLPVEQVRQQVVLFNRHLPQKLKRRETESFREWFARIGFQPSPELQQLYETVRYDPNQSPDVTKTVLTDIEQDFSAYLGQLK